MTLYRRTAGIIKDGISRKHSEMGDSWRHPTGWQAMVRVATDQSGVLIVMHQFAGNTKPIRLPLQQGNWSIDANLIGTSVAIESGFLAWTPTENFSGEVVLLRKS